MYILWDGLTGVWISSRLMLSYYKRSAALRLKNVVKSFKAHRKIYFGVLLLNIKDDTPHKIRKYLTT